MARKTLPGQYQKIERALEELEQKYKLDDLIDAEELDHLKTELAGLKDLIYDFCDLLGQRWG